MADAFPSHDPTPPSREPLAFTGDGSEYFRIWIVNIALTIVTLGIYSAWAKVRKLQYFYRNTQLAGSSFDYHGQPMAILKGRMIAGALLIASNAAGGFNPVLGIAATVLLLAVMPWLLVKSLRFRLHNTSWRGLRFRFTGPVGGGYKVFLAGPLAAAVTLGLAWPWAHREIKAFQTNHSHFGTAPFAFDAPVRGFYGVYARLAAYFVLVPAIIGAVIGFLAASASENGDGLQTMFLSGAIVAGFGFYAAFLAGRPYLMAKLQNLSWNHTRLGPHRFESSLAFGRLFWIMFSNLLLTMVTLGFYWPFAAVRLARYRVACMAMLPGEPLDRFVGERAREVEALGEEVSEFFDFDIAL